MVEKNSWDSIKERLHHSLTLEAWQNWVAKTRYEGMEAGCLRVVVPDDATRYWLEKEYAPKVSGAIRDLRLPVERVQYVLQGGPATPPASEKAENGDVRPAEFQSLSAQLNARFTFENFVVGSCNQFAHAAALAVAETPARRYNPLFIYGGSGMGKTHLVQAIGHMLLRDSPGMRIAYTTGERFVNEMVQSIRGDRMAAFHQHYRNADALLLDDVHTLAGKERTQEEFFHTFNELYDHQKQIVVTSDQLPKNIPNLVDRLRSRFEWGLLVDVSAPDLETKMAILERKAEAEGLLLPDEVKVFLATKTRSNVRELEGAFTKLVAYSSVTRSPITLGMAQQALRQLYVGSEKRITIDLIVRTVCERYDLQPAQLKQKSNAQEIARPRQVAMYLCKELTQASLPEIGRHFGGKHHTTVLHSIRKVEELRQSDPDLNRLVHSLIDTLQ